MDSILNIEEYKKQILIIIVLQIFSIFAVYLYILNYF